MRAQTDPAPCAFCGAAIPAGREYRLDRAGGEPWVACFGCYAEWERLRALNARFPEMLADPKNRACLVGWGWPIAQTWPAPSTLR